MKPEPIIIIFLLALIVILGEVFDFEHTNKGKLDDIERSCLDGGEMYVNVTFNEKQDQFVNNYYSVSDEHKKLADCK